MPGLHADNIRRCFDGVLALEDVSLTVAPGEIHGLCGENGAGKSTLIRVLGGMLHPDAGTVHVDGARLWPGDVRRAEAAGIGVLHQEPLAFGDLSAEESIFVGHEPRRCAGLWLDRGSMRRRARDLLERLGERFDPSRPVRELSLAQQQLVSIARALSRRCRYLILDEPTASLSQRETDILLDLVRKLAAEGVGILYVSHRLEEVFAIARRVTVLRDGRLVDTRDTSGLTRAALIGMMVGREVPDGPRRMAGGLRAGGVRSERASLLEVRSLTRGPAFHDVCLTVGAGEIVGLAGLVGAGRSEVARCIAGVDRAAAGSVRVAGRTLRPGSVRAAMEAGVALVPEDRRGQGLVLPLAIEANLTLAVLSSLSYRGWLRRGRERAVVRRWMHELDVRAAHAAAPAATLSGGNQQKLLLGKWLAASPRVLILDEPTRGVDVGAKAEIHSQIRRLASEGLAILLISSEMTEILNLSERVLVMREGQCVGELAADNATQAAVLALAMPQTADAAGPEARA